MRQSIRERSYGDDAGATRIALAGSPRHPQSARSSYAHMHHNSQVRLPVMLISGVLGRVFAAEEGVGVVGC